jgi:hypothetical protein
MFVERATERFRFRCVRCDTEWLDDYDSQVTEFDGETMAFYAHGGFPCEAPAAADIVCQRCHCGPVQVKLVRRQVLPLLQRWAG